MKKLRAIRIIISALLLAACAGYLLAGQRWPALAVYSAKLQIIPSAIASTIGITLFWLAATLLLGRVYCSSVCPIGTLQDMGVWLRKKIIPARGFRYKHPFRHRYDIAVIYLLCLILGLIVIPLLMEPWSMFCNICSVVKPSAQAAGWLRLGVGAGVGIAAGAVSLAAMLICGFLIGRDYCNYVCPIGTALGLMESRTIWHIEIDPEKCVSCMACEQTCRCSCIKVVSRYVDNSRCVRCFDCLSVCPNNAIRYQADKNRPRNPLMRRVSQTAPGK